MKDTYENRMLFIVMWFGAPALRTQNMFPEWFEAYMYTPPGEKSDTWLKDFCSKALDMKNKQDCVDTHEPCDTSVSVNEQEALMSTSPTIVILDKAPFKGVQISDKVLEHCAVKAMYADQLKFEELQALVNWCNCQSSDLWEDMSLQEILNVYRTTAEWDTFEAWASADWEAAYAAWNAAVIDEGNQMTPRV